MEPDTSCCHLLLIIVSAFICFEWNNMGCPGRFCPGLIVFVLFLNSLFCIGWTFYQGLLENHNPWLMGSMVLAAFAAAISMCGLIAICSPNKHGHSQEFSA
jgi:hypothetical protein